MSTLTKAKKPVRAARKTASQPVRRLAPGQPVQDSMRGTATLKNFDPSAPVLPLSDWKHA
jgi:hypothetical protein